MRTGPVSAPNERGPVACGQAKELERNMDGGLVGRTKQLGGRSKATEAGICLLVTLPSSLIHSTRPEFLCTEMMGIQERGAFTRLKRTADKGCVRHCDERSLFTHAHNVIPLSQLC